MFFKIISKLLLTSIILLVAITTNASSNFPKIKFSADKTRLASNNQDSILNGHVKIIIGDKIKISADKVLVKYKHNKIAEFIIYGKGILKEDNNTTQFTNGVFTIRETQLAAEQIIS